jgi:hypothetical protein
MSPKALLLAAALASSTAIVPVLADQTPATGANPPVAGTTVPGQPQIPLREKILFNLLDKNGDGAIDQDEFNAFAKAVFSALDANGDGKITIEELQKVMPFAGGRPGWAMGGQFMHHGPGFGPRPDRFGMDGHHGPRLDWRQGQNDQGPAGAPAQFGDNGAQQPAGGPPPAQLGDNDPQGPDGGQPSFASLDKNGDGVLTPDEFQGAAPLPPPAPAPQQ